MVEEFLSTVAYSWLGIFMACVAFIFIDFATPGNLRKQLAQGHVGLSIVAGSMILGICIIIAFSIL